MDIVKSVLSIFLLQVLIFGVIYFRKFAYLLMTKACFNEKDINKKELRYVFLMGALVFFEFPVFIMLTNPLVYLENGPISRLPLWIYQSLFLIPGLIIFIGLSIYSYREAKKGFYPYFLDANGKSTWSERFEVMSSLFYSMFISGNIFTLLDHLLVLYEYSIYLGILMSICMVGLGYIGFIILHRLLRGKQEHILKSY